MRNVALCLAVFAGLSTPSFAATLIVSSTTVKPGGTMTDEQVYNGFGCTGKNVSPQLSWGGAPKETKSFAVTMYDPDAPTGSGWWHWVLFNLPATTTNLAAGAGTGEAGKGLPQGAVQGRTDFGQAGYGGPCPPPGKPHHYIIHVYALKDKIPLHKDSPAAQVGFYINNLKIADGSMTALYGRR